MKNAPLFARILSRSHVRSTHEEGGGGGGEEEKKKNWETGGYLKPTSTLV